MRTAKEINKVFKSNFKRDIEIFKCWVLGFSLEDISKQVELRASYIRATILKRAERAIMFSNGLCWDDMPGHKPSEVIDYQKLINDFALVRNQWLGITKGLDQKQWQITNITKLRVAGMEDADIR